MKLQRYPLKPQDKRNSRSKKSTQCNAVKYQHIFKIVSKYVVITYLQLEWVNFGLTFDKKNERKKDNMPNKPPKNT